MADTFDVTTAQGLSSEEAARRLRREGYNELPAMRHRSVWAIAAEVAREPMFLLLIAGGAIYLVLGDHQEALILLAFVAVIMVITFIQERKTARALETLRDLSSPRARVIRDGQTRRIAGREVVRGDLVLLAEGDRVPADGVVLQCTNLQVDESVLTGESAPVLKMAASCEMSMERPGGGGRPFVYTGTLVVQGQGVMQVEATGAFTEFGRIGQALRMTTAERTPLQRQTGQLIRTLAIIGGLLSVLVALIFILTRGQPLQGVLVGITLAMAILPDEFAVIFIVFLALGAWRMSRQSVLTRRTHAVETLGAATVLCVDKTGTLTQNRMTVTALAADETITHLDGETAASLPDEVHEVIEYSILASARDPFDPMERAFRELGERTLVRTEHWHADWELAREYPLSRQLLAMTHAWRAPGQSGYVCAAKGAPEAIADLCHVEPDQWEEIAHGIRAMSDGGLRVLGVAHARVDTLPENQHDIPFTFVGLVGLADPVRPTVPAAVQECHNAGVRVVMITGDYPGTAQYVARVIGLARVHDVITGPELDAMGDEELRRRIRTASIFARVVPEQKLRLVQAFKANGEIVAMTGDGVNDAPALHAANIGIAMGKRGTDVAREAADMVLLDDDFTSLVAGMKMGRRVYDNLNKAMAYILAIHIPIAGMTLIPVLFDWPLVLFPAHIAFLHLIIDPASSISYEAEAADPSVMRRPPRDPRAPLFNHQALLFSLLQGGGVLLSVLAVFAIAYFNGQGADEARSLMFATLIVANLCLILINRSWSLPAWAMLRVPNASIWWVISGAIVMLGLVLYVPALRSIFRFTALHLNDLLIALAAGILSTVWFEAVKFAVNQRQRQPALVPG